MNCMKLMSQVILMNCMTMDVGLKLMSQVILMNCMTMDVGVTTVYHQWK